MHLYAKVKTLGCGANEVGPIGENERQG